MMARNSLGTGTREGTEEACTCHVTSKLMNYLFKRKLLLPLNQYQQLWNARYTKERPAKRQGWNEPSHEKLSNSIFQKLILSLILLER